MKTALFFFALLLAAVAPARAQSPPQLPSKSLLATRPDPYQDLTRQQAIRNLQTQRHEADVRTTKKFARRLKRTPSAFNSSKRQNLASPPDNQSTPDRRSEGAGK